MYLCSISDAAMAEVDVSPPRSGGGAPSPTTVGSGAPSLMVGFKEVGRLCRSGCFGGDGTSHFYGVGGEEIGVFEDRERLCRN